MTIEANNPIRVLIVEDETHNARMLKDMLQNLRPHWKVEAILESVEESVEWLANREQPDLLLLDIQLSDGISFSIFQKVRVSDSLRIIFTTAYDEYAVRAFKVNSIDYLLKPINEEELDQAFKKFEDQRKTANKIPPYSRDAEYYDKLVQSILGGQRTYRTRFLISGITSYQKLETKDIAYIYSDNKLTFAVDFNKKEYCLDYNLEKLESELNPELFFRANRKMIVNIDAVNKVSNDSGGKLKIITNPETTFEISISRLKANDFKIWMGK